MSSSPSRLMPTLVALVLILAMQFRSAAAIDSAAGYYEDAVARLAAGEVPAAVIQLKNALQRDPGFLPAHVLLGTTYLQQGDAGAAEKALLTANRLGADRALTTVPLARAFLQQGKLKSIVDELPPTGLPIPVQAELYALRGEAYLSLGDLDRSTDAYAEAVRLDPRSPVGPLGQTTVALHRGDLAAARKFAESAARIAPHKAETWNVMASVNHAASETDAALKGYGKALDLDPKHRDARLARASLLMDLGRDTEADADLSALREAVPNDPRAAYLRAVLLARKGEEAASRESLMLAANVLAAMPQSEIESNTQLLLLAGLVNYGLGQFEQARPYLASYVRQRPGHAGPRKLLGSVLLAQREFDAAVSVLEPALKTEGGDFQTLTLLGSALMGKREHARAATLLAQAAELSGGAPQVQARLGLSRLGAGQFEPGLQDLATAFARDPGQTGAGVALAAGYLRRGEASRALPVVQALADRQPENLTVLNLLATAQVATGDRAGGRAILERALTVDRSFVPARINLARLDLAEGNREGARKRLQELIKEQPKNIQALLELARVEEADGRTDDALRALEKARGTDGRAVAPRLQLVDLQLRRGDAQAALAVAREAEGIAPESLSVLSALARTHLALGRDDIARVVAQQMSSLAGTDPAWLERTARLQRAARDDAGALWSLQKAVNGHPANVPARVSLAEAELEFGSLERAEEHGRILQERHPELAAGYRLVGDAQLRAGKAWEAQASYQAGLTHEKSVALAIRLYQALSLAGKKPRAREVLEGWLSEKPTDLVHA